MTRQRRPKPPSRSPSSDDQSPPSASEEEDVPIDEHTRQVIINEYEQQQEEKQKMEQAVRDAEVTLMPSAERLEYATMRMRERLQQVRDDYLTILDQYRHLIRSCPLTAHAAAEYSIYEFFPYLLLPRKTGHDVLRDVRSSVEKQMLQKYGTSHSHMIQDLANTWYAATKEALGFTSNAVPHTAILQCMLPLYAGNKIKPPHLPVTNKTQNPRHP